MSNFNECNIPFEVDVWGELEKHLETGFRGVTSVAFSYEAATRVLVVIISRLEEKAVVITREGKEADDLLMNICERFNIPYHRTSTVRFTIEPGEVPVFNLDVYPYVNCADTLNRTKSRRNVRTID
ncbi:hypothetical protein K7T73_12535 [Bacillus badius]|uniref:hypothetical protein n=1 Tax=Bacillus badius TaxID=1455 RepID=UPI001CC01F28|nr:hypothetical protein [Bacillus badius]UAT29427.1 hypothetical protein K7T73_12535 [Bacillus badius]